MMPRRNRPPQPHNRVAAICSRPAVLRSPSAARPHRSGQPQIAKSSRPNLPKACCTNITPTSGQHRLPKHHSLKVREVCDRREGRTKPRSTRDEALRIGAQPGEVVRDGGAGHAQPLPLA